MSCDVAYTVSRLNLFPPQLKELNELKELTAVPIGLKTI